VEIMGKGEYWKMCACNTFFLRYHTDCYMKFYLSSIEKAKVHVYENVSFFKRALVLTTLSLRGKLSFQRTWGMQLQHLRCHLHFLFWISFPRSQICSYSYTLGSFTYFMGPCGGF
jgi:hypothetical protein